MNEKNQGPPEPPVPETTQPAGDRTKEFFAASKSRTEDAEQKFLRERLKLVESDPNLTDEKKKAAVRDLQRRLHALRKQNKAD